MALSLRKQWRGFPLQLILFVIIPLISVTLVIVVASEIIHNQAMRSMSAGQSLRTVKVAADSLAMSFNSQADLLRWHARGLGNPESMANLPITSGEIYSQFEGGLALYDAGGNLVDALNGGIDWSTQQLPLQAALDALRSSRDSIFSPVVHAEDDNLYILVTAATPSGNLLVGAFDLPRVSLDTLGRLVSGFPSSLYLAQPSDGRVVFALGALETGETAEVRASILQALAGNSGFTFHKARGHDHTIAYSQVKGTGWALVLEETWLTSDDPSLRFTQLLPLFLVVLVILLSLGMLWFGIHNIVFPLQKLERSASQIQLGDDDAIRAPVGGIREITHLQDTLKALLDELLAARESLRGYIGVMTHRVEEERRSLARELHDDAIQTLMSVNHRIQMLELQATGQHKIALDELDLIMQQAVINLRQVIRNLRPVNLDEMGLVPAIKNLVTYANSRRSIEISLEVVGVPCRLEPTVELALYRIVQEGLNNILHHSKAENAWIRLDFSSDSLIITLRDNGQGFPTPASWIDYARKDHYGLLGMHERATLVGATISLLTQPGGGTELTVSTACRPYITPSQQ
jgi:signal transduction histidine kinase